LLTSLLWAAVGEAGQWTTSTEFTVVVVAAGTLPPTPAGLYQAILLSRLAVAVTVQALVAVTVVQEALVHLALFLLTVEAAGLVRQVLNQEAPTTTVVTVALEEAPMVLDLVTEIELAH
jgi:hypothetical protein